ncbi:putative Zinc metalloproteinase nas-4 [Hypsibius exemplaris]|uniref:Metalloendopeptidase n=1 Tax=Hypsibius exemplaris TaxID=2072580 RepID=A0A1W0WBT1_HYPEX|nr:putative Zinc metalloproteinase nas-4 [Hypsibius exemplaris]
MTWSVISLVSLFLLTVEGRAISKRSASAPSNWRDLIGDDVYQYYLDPKTHRPGNGGFFEGDIKGVDKTAAGGEKDANGNAVLGQNAVMSKSQLWPNALVPYTIGSGYSSQQKSVIVGALKDMMSKTCVRFVERTNERDYITFVNRNAGCSSYVARTGGQQQIDLQEGCIYQFGEVQHEVMHALGFFHEQSRKDRDEYITIVWDNIQKDNYDQFEKYQSNLLGLTYDYDSIMHYGWNYFALDRSQPTMVPKKKASIGNRKAMSPTDIKKINILYECTGSRAPAPSSGSSSGGSRPSSSGSTSSSRKGTSIWDLILGRGSSDNESGTARPTTKKSSLLSSIFSGLFGG